jgi:hypothetical protein
MIRFFKVLVILISFTLSANGSYQLVKELDIPGKQAYLDPFARIYLVKGHVLVKLDENNKELYQYSSPLSGDIAHVDVSNPLKILVFYKESNQLVFLDKQLSPVQEPVSLDDLGFFTPLSVCSSSLGGFWVLSGESGRLAHVDNHLRITRESHSFKSLFPGETYQMLEKNHHVYIGIPDKKILAFNHLGQLSNEWPLPVQTQFQARKNRLIFPVENKVVVFDQNLLEKNVILERKDYIYKSYILQEKLFVFLKHTIQIYIEK